MSEKKSCTGRDSAEALAAILGYTDKFWAIETSYSLSLWQSATPGCRRNSSRT